MAVVTYQDVAISLGRPISDPDEQAQVTQWIADAEMLISARLGDLAALDQGVLAYVVREAVILKIRNPEGKQREAIDDYNYSRYDDAARGEVFIRDDWWDLLAPAGASDAFTVTPYGATGSAEPDAWVTTTDKA